MAFKARLNFSGKEYDVLNCSYALNRDVDSKGRPSSGVYGGTIDIEVESTEDTSIIEAMVNNQYKPVTGTLLIKKSEEDAKMKELSFEDGYIVKYSEGLDITGETPMSYKFTISARKLKLGNAEHVNDWPGRTN
ncbi:type VI secretion system tube protein TssD [Mucilaginibacter sp. KACC 22063]|uniref:type VI secretion system tube protein TssD n=1 Tax=Mucilaginibacter sp. KACC 22063 TaxID=3025666 RepID=UPI0023662769|nr:type VI secretion system tube protein TssD [Mucilaginibacter sp. KACC 22063]WDF53490.1 type VI secretion system tube protein TssD [Mucilaginibacter sp. KACC 22063]WDF53949.1 type VI secretion system tube protein TssD [Mucilaginibacter sp. KACC 22063]WDF54393.1 type VI secretion system tube protein TssD [Mucilaginibacter sp. KACC 22063]